MIKINGVTIITPKLFEVDFNDLDNEATRNAKGDLLRDRIAVKRVLTCEWGPLSMSEISTLLTAVQDVYFSVEYPDPMVGGLATKTFYVGSRKAPMYWKNPQSGEYLWKGLKMDFIEK